MKTDFDVAIVGWGPAGATLGNLLAKEGLSVCVLERANDPYPSPRATHFDGESMRIFQTIGIADELLRNMRAHVGIRFVDADHNLLAHWPRSPKVGAQAWHDSYRFHQPMLEALLRRNFSKFENCQAIEGAYVYDIDQEEDRVVVRFETAADLKLSSITCKFVVGCDGARSTVRRFMGSPIDELHGRERWLVVDLVCNGPNDLPDGTVQLCDPKRPTTFANCVGARRRWEFMVMPGDDVKTMASPANVWKLLAPWLSPDQAEIERAVVYTFYASLVRGWRRGRLFVAGDAAHQMPPFLGQGLCSGLRDVANLAWKLAAVINCRAPADLLDTYESERSPHVKEYIELAVKVGSIIQTVDPVAAAERNRAMASSPPVMQSIKPPLGPGLHNGGGPPAGTLSAQPMTRDGRRLDDLIGYSPCLLISSELMNQISEKTRQQLSDVRTVVLERECRSYLDELTVEAVLLRPDRYVLGVANSELQLQDMISKLPIYARSAEPLSANAAVFG